MVGGTEGLGGILDDRKLTMADRDLVDCRHVGGLAENADRHDRLGALRDGRLDLGRVHVPGLGVDVDKDRGGTEERNHLGGRDPGVGDRDDFVAGADTERHEGNEEGVGPARNADAMLDADVAGEALLELSNLWTENVTPVIENGSNAPVELGTDPGLLGLEINEFHLPGKGDC